jgi:hypothetical protein
MIAAAAAAVALGMAALLGPAVAMMLWAPPDAVRLAAGQLRC